MAKEDDKKVHFLLEAPKADNEITEQFGINHFKTLVKRTPIMFPADLGESHPFDMSITEGLYLKFGFVNAIVEKITEYVWGSGIFVESENPNAQAIIEQWMQDVQFPSLGKKWTREGLVKGNGYFELGGSINEGINGIKIPDAKFIYVKRDIEDNILNYKQLIKTFPKDRNMQKQPLINNEDFVELNPENIVHLKINTIGDGAYGY